MDGDVAKSLEIAARAGYWMTGPADVDVRLI
jgi:hypothetical protein